MADVDDLRDADDADNIDTDFLHILNSDSDSDGEEFKGFNLNDVVEHVSIRTVPIDQLPNDRNYEEDTWNGWINVCRDMNVREFAPTSSVGLNGDFQEL